MLPPDSRTQRLANPVAAGHAAQVKVVITTQAKYDACTCRVRNPLRGEQLCKRAEQSDYGVAAVRQSV